jgi:uncharacterized lipoprotein YajG
MGGLVRQGETMKFVGLMLALVALVGCATPQVTMPVGVASVAYAQARADYATAAILVTQACVAGKLDKQACDAAAAIDVRAKVLKQSIESALMNPSQPIDWGQVLQYTASVAELLIKVGVLVP